MLKTWVQARNQRIVERATGPRWWLWPLTGVLGGVANFAAYLGLRSLMGQEIDLFVGLTNAVTFAAVWVGVSVVITYAIRTRRGQGPAE